MKTGACVLEERKCLRQCPNVSPVPFSYGAMLVKIVSRDRFHADLDESLEGIFVRIGTTADNYSRYPDFHASRADPKIMKTRLGVGCRGGNLRDRQECPLRIAEGHQVSSSRSGFGHQSVSYCSKRVGISSCRLASNIILSMHVRRDEDCYPQKRTSPHTPPRVRPGGNLTARSTVVPHMGDIVTFRGNN